MVTIVAAMAIELTSEMLRAGELGHDLRESEQRLKLATEAARLGIWVRDLGRNEIWASDTWRDFWGFSESEKIQFRYCYPENTP